MTDTTYNVMKPEKGVPIKTWTKGVQLEDPAPACPSVSPKEMGSKF
jgi:hypothetical protein